MKLRTSCCLGLLMAIGSMATAQRVASLPALPCGAPPPKAVIDWAQFRFEPCHTGFNPYEFVLGPATVVNLGLRWQYSAEVDISSPAVANGVVYVGSIDGNVYALNARTGALVWQYPTGGYIQSSPAVANGVVYVGSEDGNLYALNASTGALLWQDFAGGSSSPAVANGLLYFASDFGNLYVFGL